MTYGAEIWGPPLINAAASTASGLLGNRGQKETKQQKMSRNVAKDLIASLTGEGPYSSLFSTNEADFQKGFVEPALSRFQNQIAPQIQQQYIASGQQRGTGLDDTLTRAGVDLNQMLNENFLNYQQGGQNRSLQAINAALGLGAGAPQQMSAGEAAGQGFAGFLSSPGFGNFATDIFKGFGQNQNNQTPAQGSFYRGYETQPPKGFSRDYGT